MRFHLLLAWATALAVASAGCQDVPVYEPPPATALAGPSSAGDAAATAASLATLRADGLRITRIDGTLVRRSREPFPVPAGTRDVQYAIGDHMSGYRAGFRHTFVGGRSYVLRTRYVKAGWFRHELDAVVLVDESTGRETVVDGRSPAGASR